MLRYKDQIIRRGWGEGEAPVITSFPEGYWALNLMRDELELPDTTKNPNCNRSRLNKCCFEAVGC